MKRCPAPFPIARTLLAGLALAFSTAHAATFTVKNTADAGTGSLRQAILDANMVPGPDVITFSIPGSGVQRIALASELPAITDPVTINGYTQTGASANTLTDGFNAVINVFVDGSTIPPSTSTIFTETYGLTFRNTAPGSRVSGLKLSGFTFGIVMANADSITVDGNKVLDNGSAQILVTGNSNAIGVPGITGRNLISGKAEGILIAGDGNVIRNNYIGFAESMGEKPSTNAASNGIKAFFGKIGVAYNSQVVKGSDLICRTNCGLAFMSNNHLIGGMEKGQGNVIIGQALAGLITQGASNGSRSSASMRVEGNRFGVSFDGKRVPGFGNFFGVFLNHKGPSINIIRSNTIAEGQVGIVVEAGKGNAPITGAKLSANSIVGQSRMAIDLGDDNRDANDVLDGDGGDNNKQNFPVLSGPSPSGGGWRLASAPSESFTLEFFQSGGNCKIPEADVFLGAFPVTTDAAGNAIFTGPLGMLPGGFITATATDKAGNTSELSDCVTAAKLKSSVAITSWKTPVRAGAWDARFEMSVGGAGLFTPTGSVQLWSVSQDPLMADVWFGSSPLHGTTALWDQFPVSRTPGIFRAKAIYPGDSAFDASVSNTVDVVVYDVKNACTSSTSDLFRADFSGGQAMPGTYQVVQGSDIAAGNVGLWRPLPLASDKRILAAGIFDGWIRPSLLARDASGNVTVEFCNIGYFDTYAVSGWQPGNVVDVGRFFKSAQHGIVVATGAKRFEARLLPDGFSPNMPVLRTDVLRDETLNFTIGSLSIAAIGDFDGDGNDDIIWDVDGRLELWLMNGTVPKGQTVFGPPVTSVNGLPVAFGIAGVGDFDGDGRVDIVWRGGDYYYVAMMDGASLKDPSTAPVPNGNIPADWKLKAVADYDGDGKADLLWRFEGASGGAFPPGTYVINYMSGNVATRQSPLGLLAPLTTDFIDP